MIMQENLSRQLSAAGVIPVVTIPSVNQARPLAEALVQGGLPVAEITLRTAEAIRCIELIRQANPEMVVGAGTVLTVQQARDAVAAGAQFIVSPGTVREVISWCLDQQVPVYPGVCTPTEVCRALELGVKDLKFFPASIFGGLRTAKALLSVFTDIRLMPTGGISLDNAAEYLLTPGILCCGGSYIAPSNLLREENYSAISRLASETVALVNKVHSKTILSSRD